MKGKLQVRLEEGGVAELSRGASPQPPRVRLPGRPPNVGRLPDAQGPARACLSRAALFT